MSSGEVVRVRVRVRGRVVVLAAVLDLVLVLAFVVIGRRSHDESNAVLGLFTTLWPFLAGAVIGWVVARAWRAPLRIRWTGVIVWVSTVLFGMLLRIVSAQGVEWSFVAVATIVLGVFLVGWRAVALLVVRARKSR
jgi:peptidoglycan/LPS O-acetylase OafA/YrhL